jgi:hypothetical protein
MIARRLAIAALAAACAALAAVPALASPLSAAAYRDRADSICAAAQRKLARIAEPTRASQIERYLARSLATLEPSLSALRGLEAPAALRAPAARYLTLQAQQQGVLENLLARIHRGADPARSFAASTPDINRRMVRINDAAHAVGFRVCGVVNSG